MTRRGWLSCVAKAAAGALAVPWHGLTRTKRELCCTDCDPVWSDRLIRECKDRAWEIVGVEEIKDDWFRWQGQWINNYRRNKFWLYYREIEDV